MEQKRKILALVLIGILICHLYGTFSIISIHSVFASNDTYSVENVIYLNATSMGKGSIYKLVISDDLEEKPLINIKSDINTSPFVQDISLHTFLIEDINEYTKSNLGQIKISNATLDLTNAKKGILTTYNNYTMGENLTEFYQNFQELNYYFPVEKKELVFDSPKNYALKFCSDNGLTLENVVNSTYVENFDINTLNLFKSELVKTDFLITDNLPDYSTMGDLGTKAFPWIIAIIAVVLILTMPAITDCILNSQRIQATKDLALHQIWADAIVTVNAINGETSVQLNLTSAKAENEAMIIEAFTNGSISFEECQTLLKLVGADYSALLSQREQNIVNITQDYFAHVEEQWESYENGLAISTSWIDWLYIIIVILIVSFTIYIVYYFLVTRKSRETQGVTNYLVVK